MSIKTSQPILKCFIDLKSSVWFTARFSRRNRVLWHLEFFSARLPVKVFKTRNGRQSYILSKFHKLKKFSRSELSSRDPEQTSRFCGISISCFCWSHGLWMFVTIFCPKHGVTGDVWRHNIYEIYWEYRTTGHLAEFWKPWPAVELKTVLSVTKHGFVCWAQRKPNTRLEIYNAFQDRLTCLNRHMIV